MNKKLIASLLATMMLLGTTMTALAADDDDAAAATNEEVTEAVNEAEKDQEGKTESEVSEDAEEAKDGELLIATAEDNEEETVDQVNITLTIGEKSIFSNGEATELDVAPCIINNRTMVPLRAIFEALGAVVSWDDESKTVLAAKGDTVIVMQVGQAVMYVNEDKVELDSPSVIVDNRTLVPARAIAEAFGNEVGYDVETKTVTIASPVVEVTEPADEISSETDAEPAEEAQEADDAADDAADEATEAETAADETDADIVDEDASDAKTE